VIDEFTGEYRNFHRMLAMGEHRRTPTPWLDTLRPAADALRVTRDNTLRPAADALRVTRDRPLPILAALVAPALLVGGWLAARRRARRPLWPWSAMALVAVPIAVRYVPGRAFLPTCSSGPRS
jgi:hypothetical protein